MIKTIDSVNFLHQPRKNLSIIFFPIFFILIMMGFWQINRHFEKEESIRQTISAINGGAKNFEQNQEPLAPYQKLQINCQIKKQDIMWLYRRHPMAKYQDGSYLAAKFKSGEKEGVIILGWVLEKDRKKFISSDSAEEISASVTTITIPSEKESYFIPKNNYEKNILFTMNMDEVGKHMLGKPSKYFFAALDNKDFGSLKILPISASMMLKIKNDHLGYASFWFCLAICFATVIFMLTRQTKEEHHA
ncbi:MAG: SURF1 family cytochrome oxidase biogenesis protein [Rickettsiaceae bacterium]|nr:SURF1 family cytochrome oxidase biogenesis protein [Rickettsiaceae bacterium]